MKLFSLNSYLDPGVVMAAASAMPMMGVAPVYVPDGYPPAVEGIELGEDRCLMLGGERKLAVSKELLESDNEQFIRRERHRVFLLQASIDTVDGIKTLVPPKAGDDNAAGVKLDLSGYPYAEIRYRPNEQQLLAAVGADEGYTDERLFARIERFEPLIAERVDYKYWFFGEKILRERLSIKFDGRTLFYDIERIKRPPSRWRLFG